MLSFLAPFETSLEEEEVEVPPQTVSAAVVVVVAAAQGEEVFSDLEIFLEVEAEGLPMMELKVLSLLAMMSFTPLTVEEIPIKELESCAFPMDYFARTG